MEANWAKTLALVGIYLSEQAIAQSPTTMIYVYYDTEYGLPRRLLATTIVSLGGKKMGMM